MITCLMGHRGVGKTSLLQRLESYYAEDGRKVLCFDLDREIEIKHGSIIGLFEKGETHFRQIEKENFELLLKKAQSFSEDVFIALGAGFPIHELPKDLPRIWIRRDSDGAGRIFLDRPRLNASVSALRESQQKFAEREIGFEQEAWETWTLPEGLKSPNPIEKQFFLRQLMDVGGNLTILPENLRSHDIFRYWWSRRQFWSVDFFEVRNDLLSNEQISMVLSLIPKNKILYSFRKKGAPLLSDVEAHSYGAFDWALELGACPYKKAPIISIHEKETNIEDAIYKLEMAGRGYSQLKLCLPVENFQELRVGHLWAVLKKEKRSFLPRSSEGRFAWYRLVHKALYKVNFFREGNGSNADQPTLYQWVAAERDPYRFAAVLGDPVRHSWTPIEQGPFFQPKYIPVLAVQLHESEWQEALPILREMGLQFAAVTAPFKMKAFASCKDLAPLAHELESVNTLYYDHKLGGWKGENTDLAGLQKAAETLDKRQSTAVWGGRGTLSVLKRVFPEAHFYAGSSGEKVAGTLVEAPALKPEILIWGASRGANGEFVTPPGSWKPSKVFDLNYREDSSGKEYALSIGAEYISGEGMFRAQAQNQRKFWEKCE